MALHTNSALTRHWQNRFTPGQFDHGTRDATPLELRNTFDAQCAIRREFRRICDNHVKSLFVADAKSAGIKRADRQHCVRFDEVAAACTYLYNKKESKEEKEKTHLMLFKFKYHSPSFKKSWEKPATELVMHENNLVLRDPHHFVVGVKKCTFVKMMSIALTKLRSNRLCHDLVLNRPQQPILVEENGVMKNTGKKKRNRIKKADAEYDPKVHLRVAIDLTGDDDICTSRKIRKTGVELANAIRAHFREGGDPILNEADFNQILWRDGNDTGATLVTPTADSQSLTNHGFGEPAGTGQTLPQRTVPRASSEESQRAPGLLLSNTATEVKDDATVECSDDLSNETVADLATPLPSPTAIPPVAQVVDDGKEKCCGNCKLRPEVDAFALRYRQYWLNGMKCAGSQEINGKTVKCDRKFDERSVKKDEVLVVCRESANWRDEDKRIRICNVVYCIACQPEARGSGRGGRSRRVVSV